MVKKRILCQLIFHDNFIMRYRLQWVPVNGFQRKGRYYIAFDRALKPSVKLTKCFAVKKWLTTV
jgi:hypothetical protein